MIEQKAKVMTGELRLNDVSCIQVTPVTPMSTDTWNISFAKYLEIRFHGSVFQRRASAEPCAHSLHHDHFQYFGFKDTVASFK